MLLNCIFAISGIVFTALILIHKKYCENVKDNIKISNYVTYMGFSLAIYVVLAFILAIFSKNHIVMLLFGLSPFIIGKFATYKTRNIYSAIQILCILLSIVYVFMG